MSSTIDGPGWAIVRIRGRFERSNVNRAGNRERYQGTERPIASKLPASYPRLDGHER